MMSFPRRAVAFALALLLAACAAMTSSADAPDLNGTAWVLASLPGQTLLADAVPTAQFEGGRVQGTDGCNRYFAPYTRTGSALQVGERGGMTMMACPPAVTRQAEAFMKALTGARSYRVADSRLQLLAADGAVLATLAAQPKSLAGTSWRVTAYNNGRQAVVSTLTGTNLTMAFSNDGRVSGSAGCNTFTGPYTADGGKLSFGPAAATRRMCVQPEGVMEQEQRFLAALRTVATARFEGDRLELRTADGALAATLSKAAAP
jgi:heat shock protein HslJ